MLKQREADQPLERAEIHDVLSNDRRWRVLELLAEENPRDLRSLADDIAAAESGESPAPREVRQSVYVTLHQNHLPKLDSLGIVQYDDTSKMVELGERAEDIDVYLDVVDDGHLSWNEFYLGVVVLGLTATFASAAGTPLLAALDPVVYAAGALVMLFASLAYQIRDRGGQWFDRFTGQ
jgi:predicted transcriptional regulator